MVQMQSSPDEANVGNTDQKYTATITDAVVANGKSINIVDQEKQRSSTLKDRLNKNVNRLSSWKTLVRSILMIPGFAIELSYGIIYANQCPIQPLINIFLIVHGCSLMTNAILLLIGFVAARCIKRSLTPLPCSQRLVVGSIIGQLIILLFDIVWLIVGQVWVFGAQRNGVQTSNSTLTTTYCHSNLFWSGFVLIIINYAVLLIIILVVVIRFIMKRRKIKQGTTTSMNEHI